MNSPAQPAADHRARRLDAACRRHGAAYPAQAAAHLYVIASGLSLTTRWLAQCGIGRRAADVLSERRGLQRRFARFFALLDRWNVLTVEFEGFDDCAEWRGSVVAPNHPSILDAPALIARVPGLDCIMNARLLHDPVMAGAARLGGYICNNAPIRMLRICQERLTAGSNVLIFPEGTRTTTPPLGPFHQGYALAATRAGAPVRTVFIECDSLYFGRGFSFFRPAPCPMAIRISAGRVFPTSRGDDARALSAEVAGYFRDNLAGDAQGISRRTA